jgi:hypothetical protein
LQSSNSFILSTGEQVPEDMPNMDFYPSFKTSEDLQRFIDETLDPSWVGESAEECVNGLFEAFRKDALCFCRGNLVDPEWPQALYMLACAAKRVDYSQVIHMLSISLLLASISWLACTSD